MKKIDFFGGHTFFLEKLRNPHRGFLQNFLSKPAELPLEEGLKQAITVSA